MSKIVSFSIPNESCILQVSIAVQKNRDTQQQHQQPHHQPQSYGRVQQQQSRQYGTGMAQQLSWQYGTGMVGFIMNSQQYVR